MITYPYLPEGRDIKYVPATNVFMIEAKSFCKTHTTDRNHSTGAVIVRDGQIIGHGANQSGFSNPKLIEMHRKGMCVRKWFKIKSGEKYWLCPGCVSSKDHAEGRAIRNALSMSHKNIHKKPQQAEGGMIDGIKGADIYLWGHWWCCKTCWDAIIQAGINDVYLIEGSEVLFDRSNPNNKLGLFD